MSTNCLEKHEKKEANDKSTQDTQAHRDAYMYETYRSINILIDAFIRAVERQK